MGRIRRIEDEMVYTEEPMVAKKEEKNNDGNGFIPVKYDTVDVFYDTHEGTYFAVVRMEGKKLRFELVK